MIVLDASAVVDLMLNQEPSAAFVRERITEFAPEIYAPHLLDAEVAQVLRRYVLSNELAPQAAREIIGDLGRLPITRYPHQMFISRAFELRDNATIYDALYLVLAEALAATLVTSDGALASVPGHRARVVLAR